MRKTCFSVLCLVFIFHLILLLECFANSTNLSSISLSQPFTKKDRKKEKKKKSKEKKRLSKVNIFRYTLYRVLFLSQYFLFLFANGLFTSEQLPSTSISGGKEEKIPEENQYISTCAVSAALVDRLDILSRIVLSYI